MTTTTPLTERDAELIVSLYYHHYSDNSPAIEALLAHANGKLVSIDALEYAVQQLELARVRLLATDSDAAFLACSNGGVKLRPDDALAVAGLSRVELDNLRRDAALGIAVMQFLHNARSACREVSLEALMQQIMEMAERARIPGASV